MSLEGMRDLLRGTLGRTLDGLSDEDRLAAAWAVACGKAMAGRGTVVGYADGIVRVQVEDRVVAATVDEYARPTCWRDGADRGSKGERYTL